MQFPILSLITFTPIVAAVILLLMNPERKTEIRVVALAAAVFDLLLSLWLFGTYYFQYKTGGYQFIEAYDWLRTPMLNIQLKFGVDGMSVRWCC